MTEDHKQLSFYNISEESVLIVRRKNPNGPISFTVWLNIYRLYIVFIYINAFDWDVGKFYWNFVIYKRQYEN